MSIFAYHPTNYYITVSHLYPGTGQIVRLCKITGPVKKRFPNSSNTLQTLLATIYIIIYLILKVTTQIFA